METRKEKKEREREREEEERTRKKTHTQHSKSPSEIELVRISVESLPLCLFITVVMTYVELDKRICPDTLQSEYSWYDVVQHRGLQVARGSFFGMLDRQL